jgi:hypothetical protein
VQEFAALQASLKRARRIRSALFFAALLFVVATCVTLYQFGARLGSTENREAIISLAQKHLGEHSDEYMKEVNLLVENSGPVVYDAFYKQAKKDLPAYLRGVQTERDAFVTDIRADLEKKLADHYHKVLDQHRETLKKEFPDAQNAELQQKMTDNLNVVFEKMVKKYYVDDLNTQLVAFYDAWDHFPAAAPPAKGDVPIEDQFIGTLLDFLKHNLTN